MFLLFLALANARPQGDFYPLPPVWLGQGGAAAGTGTGMGGAAAYGVDSYSSGMMGYGMEDEYTWEKIYDDLNMDDWFDNDIMKYGGMGAGMGSMYSDPYYSSGYMYSPYSSSGSAGGSASGGSSYGSGSSYGQGSSTGGSNPYSSYSSYGYGSPYFYDYDMFDNDWWDIWDDGAANGPRDCTKYGTKNKCHGKTTGTNGKASGHCVWNVNNIECVECANGDQACLCQRYDEYHGKEFCIRNNNCAWSISNHRCMRSVEVAVADQQKPKSSKPQYVDNCHNFFEPEQCFGLTQDGYHCMWNGFDGECNSVEKKDFAQGLCGIHASQTRCESETRQGVACTFTDEGRCLPQAGSKPTQPTTAKSSEGFHYSATISHPQLQSTHTEPTSSSSNKWDNWFVPVVTLLAVSTALNVAGWAYYFYTQRSTQKTRGLLEDVQMDLTQ